MASDPIVFRQTVCFPTSPTTLRQIQKLKQTEVRVPAYRSQNHSVGDGGRQEIDGNEFKQYRTELPAEGR
jgi:hypothetical protein